MQYQHLSRYDLEVFQILKKEEERKAKTLELIPSENHTSSAVLEALASIFNDKYAEGYPGSRYYGGNEYIDELEILCRERAKKIFGVPFANVQSYSGSPANHAVYLATLFPGEKVMGMDLQAGGHLTHGFKVSFSGIYYQSVSYGVDKKTELLDYPQIEEIALREKPKLIFAGATAYSRHIDFSRFRQIADKVGAYLCADISHIAGLVVSDMHPSPAPYAHIITTTTHKTLRGPRGAMIMVTESGFKKDEKLPRKIDRAVFPGLQGGPHEHQIAGIAVCLKEAADSSFRIYGKQIIKNARRLAEELQKKGFRLVSGGTDNHLLLIDLRGKSIFGKDAQELLEKAGIIVNKNSIPFDQLPPANPSGLRLGTPAVTTRGMKEEEMALIASFIAKVILEKKDPLKVKENVEELCNKFPHLL